MAGGPATIAALRSRFRVSGKNGLQGLPVRAHSQGTEAITKKRDHVRAYVEKRKALETCGGHIEKLDPETVADIVVLRR